MNHTADLVWDAIRLGSPTQEAEDRTWEDPQVRFAQIMIQGEPQGRGNGKDNTHGRRALMPAPKTCHHRSVSLSSSAHRADESATAMSLLSAEGSAQLCIMNAVSKRSVGP